MTINKIYMYTEKHLNILLKRLNDLHASPINELGKRSGFSRPTISKYLFGEQLRPANQAKLIEITLDIIEEGQEKRKSLIQRSRRIIQLEQELEQEDKE